VSAFKNSHNSEEFMFIMFTQGKAAVEVHPLSIISILVGSRNYFKKKINKNWMDMFLHYAPSW